MYHIINLRRKIMRINFDRLSKLAGLPGGNTSRRSLNEHNEGKAHKHPHDRSKTPMIAPKAPS